MAAWASKGHGMRRRDGDPNNHLEAAGKSMVRNHQTSDEAIATAAGAGSQRVTMGMAAYAVSAQPVLIGTQIPRKNVQAGDPTNPGSKANHANVPYNESLGARNRIAPTAIFQQVDPAAGPTMMSAHPVPSISGRENPNFESGIQGIQSY